jgi:hypothetical protein
MELINMHKAKKWYPGSRGLFLLFSLRRERKNKPLVESGN